MNPNARDLRALTGIAAAAAAAVIPAAGAPAGTLRGMRTDLDDRMTGMQADRNRRMDDAQTADDTGAPPRRAR